MAPETLDVVSQHKTRARLETVLPRDTLDEIFAFCRTSDFIKLALTNRQMANIANGFLYHTIPRLAPDKFIAFLTTIYFYEDKAPLVRSLSGLPSSKWSQVKIFQKFSPTDLYHLIKKTGTKKAYSARHILHSPFTLLVAVFNKLHNLTMLGLHITTAWPKGAADSLFKGSSFQLRVFHTSFPFVRGLVSFLETQHDLKDIFLTFSCSLTLSDQPETVSLPAGALPSLTKISWSGTQPSTKSIRSLIERRPVDTITIYLTGLKSYGMEDSPGDDSNLRNFIDVGPYGEQIKTLFIIFSEAPFSRTHMSTIRTSFTSLKKLQLQFPKLTEQILDEVAASIHELEHVNYLIFVGSPSSIDPPKLATSMKSFFVQSDSLYSVVFVVFDRAGEYSYYVHSRYQRDRSWQYSQS